MSCTKWHQHSNRNDRDGDFKTLFLERPRAVGSNLTQHKPSLWICMRTKQPSGVEGGGRGLLLAYHTQFGFRLPLHADIPAGAFRPPVCPAVGAQPGGCPSGRGGRQGCGWGEACRRSRHLVPSLCLSASLGAGGAAPPPHVTASHPASCSCTHVSWRSGIIGPSVRVENKGPTWWVKTDRRSCLSDSGSSAFCCFVSRLY